MKQFAQNYRARPESARLIETLVGVFVMLGGVVGPLFFELNTTLSSLMIGVGALFISKTKTLEAFAAIKDNLPWGK